VTSTDAAAVKSKAIDECVNFAISIPSKFLENRKYRINGSLTWGAIVIPVKYRAGGKDSTTSNVTAGGYLGATWVWGGGFQGIKYSLTPFAFVGHTSVTASKGTGSTSQTNSLPALSAGVGADLGVWGYSAAADKSINLGVAFGYDQPYQTDGNKYNKRPYLGLITSHKWIF
jgi:hypothetical protein